MAKGYSIETCGKIASIVGGKVVEVIGAKMNENKWIEIKKLIETEEKGAIV